MPDFPAHTAVTDDSRKVTPGTLFVARGGTVTDGTKFVADAIERGAVGVVSESPIAGLSVPNVVVGDAAETLGELAHDLHGDPSTAVSVLAVTGTNGKTTTTYLLRHILREVGELGFVGLIGTVEIDDGDTVIPADMTTPSSPDIARYLQKMEDNICGACVIEASSHALQQKRLAGCTVRGAAFLNLTGDHLDYHGTMEDYAAAKALLFETLDDTGVAAVNVDDPHAARMIQACRGRVVPFSPSGDPDTTWRATDVTVTANGTTFRMHSPKESAVVSMPLIGRHNVENALAAAVLAHEVHNVWPATIAESLATATGAPGRLERVPTDKPFHAFVDYAHTDDALDNVLRALRPLCTGDLRVVFGCGGDRDKTKRPRMAAVAERNADAIYVTSDNPRTEDPAAILADTVAGLMSKPTLVDPDRRTAIRQAIANAHDGDIVLIAGKGHETYQIIGTEKTHFDDREEARTALQNTSLGR
ncbi:MAG: UDP-N-acetylmuramoyl-L-alanyl-D-glutamate--2,6-diaminopimelate ligase [Planctomycetota bacterium]